MIKALFCKLFGLCVHEWAKWDGHIFQERECKRCGKREGRIV